MKTIAGQPKVSVIIASYNHAQYVREALKSVLEQSVKEIEVIIVDDGSDDGTPDQIKKIKDPRVNLIRLNENRREHPRNIGLAKARGKYIAFQNSDDVWAKDKLKKQLDYLENHPKVVACFTAVQIIDKFSKPERNLLANYQFLCKNKKSNAWLRYFFDLGNCLCISSVLVRKEKIDEVGRFTPNLFRAADLDLWVHLAARGEFYVMKEKLTMMRIVKDKNFSAPSPEAKNCSYMELAQIYDSYARQPIVNSLSAIFKDIIPDDSSETERLGYLAIYSWKLSAPHILFANKLIGKIINNPRKRKELISKFGGKIIKKYIEKRSSIELNLNKSKSVSNLLQKFVRRLWQ